MFIKLHGKHRQSLTQLRYCVKECEFTFEQFVLLKEFVNLEELDISNCDRFYHLSNMLDNLPNLKSIKYSFKSILIKGPADVPISKPKYYLTRLAFCFTTVSDDGLNLIGQK